MLFNETGKDFVRKESREPGMMHEISGNPAQPLQCHFPISSAAATHVNVSENNSE